MFRIRKPRPVSAPDLSRLDRMDGVVGRAQGGSIPGPYVPMAPIGCVVTPSRTSADRPLPDGALDIARALGILHDAQMEEQRRLAAEQRRRDHAASEALFSFCEDEDVEAAMATFRRMGGAA